MNVLGIIPSRYGSTRFPGKALAMIHGKPMIRWVYEQAQKAKGLKQVLVATDHEQIYHEIVSNGGNAIMTATTHNNGTSRCIEVLENYKDQVDFVVNIQGDEPFIDPLAIDQLIYSLQPDTQIATLGMYMHDLQAVQNTNQVKIVKDIAGKAMYFSRLPIPYIRDIEENTKNDTHYIKHIGIYAYRIDVLLQIKYMNETVTEKAEKLEQLRWLENGIDIQVVMVNTNNASIDTPEDIQKLSF
ncbi:MAG: 3-deoxy-manno-octulosonate cytidylyltransferase [Cytophagales bacterium]|nr:3-deoxy-manno-octulosonate cytidylyltransferase [Cytophagales bacterium]